jgi:phage terminase large subunit-like protein
MMLKDEIQRRQRELQKFFVIEELKRPQNEVKRKAIIERLEPRFSQGLIYLRPDMDDLVDELIAFPRGKHDDLIDALAYQFDYLVPATAYEQTKAVNPMSAGYLFDHIGETMDMYKKFLSDLSPAKQGIFS